jgi:hypothetical protein
MDTERVALLFFCLFLIIPFLVIPFGPPFAADADEARARNVKEENANFILICPAKRRRGA